MKKLKPQAPDFRQIAGFLSGAERKLLAAKKILRVDAEASYQLAYEAMLKASLGFMLSHGQRPRSLPGHHVTIIAFVEKHLGKDIKNLIQLFDRMRRKRHQAIYDADSFISEEETQQALLTAEKYLIILRDHLQKRNPQANLFS
jgi:uncharacterized protein (UPF0332 family)